MAEAVHPVVISYKRLLQDDLSPLYHDITKAFGSGPDCLGLIILEDLPEEYAGLRERALRASAKFATLPDEVKDKYVDPKSFYNFGWSHGKEIMNGVPDTLKGSYYANPSCDTPEVTPSQRQAHASYLRNNIWPSEDDCPGFEEDVKALARFMTQTGRLLAKACDNLVAQHSNSSSVEEMIASSRCSKARLLHYYPPEGQVVSLGRSWSQAKSGNDSAKADSWCGDHVDHSLLTALCPAMYLFHPEGNNGLTPLAVPAPTESSGLFIRTRSGRELKAKIPTDCLAFQTGEALELLTRQQLKATPHYVAAGSEGAILPSVTAAIDMKKAQDPTWRDVQSGVISRETMAVFLQPDVEEVIGPDGETFGQFTRRILESHHDSETGK